MPARRNKLRHEPPRLPLLARGEARRPRPGAALGHRHHTEPAHARGRRRRVRGRDAAARAREPAALGAHGGGPALLPRVGALPRGQRVALCRRARAPRRLPAARARPRRRLLLLAVAAAAAGGAAVDGGVGQRRRRDGRARRLAARLAHRGAPQGDPARVRRDDRPAPPRLWRRIRLPLPGGLGRVLVGAPHRRRARDRAAARRRRLLAPRARAAPRLCAVRRAQFIRRNSDAQF